MKRYILTLIILTYISQVFAQHWQLGSAIKKPSKIMIERGMIIWNDTDADSIKTIYGGIIYNGAVFMDSVTLFLDYIDYNNGYTPDLIFVDSPSYKFLLFNDKRIIKALY